MKISKKGEQVPGGIGVSSEVVEAIAQSLAKHNKTGILTILEVNDSALELHRLCIEENYPVILKPIMVKTKSFKESAKAPFLGIDQDLQTMGSCKLVQSQLHYPLSHLRQLLHLGHLTSIKNTAENLLTIEDGENCYLVYLEGVGERYKDEDLMNPDSRFYKEVPKGELWFHDLEGQPIQVLGAQVGGQEKLIIADIDAHSFAEHYTVYPKGADFAEQQKSYNTANADDRARLKIAVERYIDSYGGLLDRTERSELQRLTPQMLDIHDTMGNVTLNQYLAFFWLNYECSRLGIIDKILQHGPTSEYPGEAELGKFPDLEDQKFYAAIYPDASVVRFDGAGELACFYKLLKNSNYIFNVHQSWEAHMQRVTADELSRVSRTLEAQHLYPGRYGRPAGLASGASASGVGVFANTQLRAHGQNSGVQPPR